MNNDPWRFSIFKTDPLNISSGNVLLKIGTGETKECPKEVVKMFGVLKEMLEFDILDEDFPVDLPGVDSMEHLNRVVEWCKGYLAMREPVHNRRGRDIHDFVRQKEHFEEACRVLLKEKEVTKACYLTVVYLDIPHLLTEMNNAMCGYLARMTPEEGDKFMGNLRLH